MLQKFSFILFLRRTSKILSMLYNVIFILLFFIIIYFYIFLYYYFLLFFILLLLLLFLYYYFCYFYVINIFIFPFHREDSLSKAVDEIIQINEETNISKSSKRKQKSAKDKQLIEELKNSLSVGNQSIGTISKHDFGKLNQAKEVIISIRNELEFHQKQTIKYALLPGQSFVRIQELCKIQNKFFDFIKECHIKWSRSYIHFLISLYIFSKEYPKICNLSVSLYFVKNNFKSIKLAIMSSNVEREYWKAS